MDRKQSEQEKINENRRKAVRNLLSGSGVAAGAAVTSAVWIEPVVNAVVVPAHAQTSDGTTTMQAECCPYYFDPVLGWCYDDGAAQNGNTGPVPGGFIDYNWNQPDNCPVP